MIAYNLLDKTSRRMLDGIPPSPEPATSPYLKPSSPGTPGSPTKSFSDGKRARLIKYLGKPTSANTLSRLVTFRSSLPSSEDSFDPYATLESSPFSYYHGSPVSIIESNSGSSDLTSMSMKLRQWGHDHKIRLSHDIPLWFQKVYRYHQYRKAKRLGHTHESAAAAAAASVDLDRESMFECYKEYRATRSNSTSRSENCSSPDELLDEINTLSSTIPLFCPMHTLSLEEQDDLRRDMFGEEYLSDCADERYPLLEPESYDSASSVENFKVSPESTPQIQLGNACPSSSSPHVPGMLVRRYKVTSPRDKHRHQVTPELSPSTIADSGTTSGGSSSKSSNGQRSASHASTYSASSSFSMVTVSIPTVRNNDFLASLADTISEGQPIDPVYHPNEIIMPAVDTNKSTSASKSAVSGVIDIMNPKTFDPLLCNDVESLSSSSSSQISAPASLGSNADVSNATIKFDDFAQVVLYDDNGRLRRGPSAYKRDSMRRLKKIHESPYPLTSEQRSQRFKQHCSLRLYETIPTTAVNDHMDSHDDVEFPSIRLSESCRLKIPSFSLLSRADSLQQSTKWKKMLSTQHLERRSILKSKTNEKCHLEHEVAQSLDSVGVEEFMTVVETVEMLRQKQLPTLGTERHQQMAKYYESLGGKPSQILSIF